MTHDPSTSTRRLAMWSGPRNISTALLRAFENRSDTHVVDEPLYAFYLERTGKQHPGREDVLKSQSTDWRHVVAELRGALPEGVGVFYQKHMAHHLLPEVSLDAWEGFEHAFLIRDPARMLVSLDKVTPNPSLEDTGLPQQVALFERERAARAGIVIDSDDVLADPRGLLTALCEAWGIPFDDRMLTWPAGPRATDGAWAPHWYAAVERSTGFQPPRTEAVTVPERLQPVLERCRPYYDALHAARLRP